MTQQEKIDKICEVIGLGNNTTESMKQQIYSIRSTLDEDMCARLDIKKPRKEIRKIDETNLLTKDNHLLGCNLESYADVLRYRHFEKEADKLDEIASRIK